MVHPHGFKAYFHSRHYFFSSVEDLQVATDIFDTGQLVKQSLHCLGSFNLDFHPLYDQFHGLVF